MASFTAFLDISGHMYPLYRYELSMHQETDTLGRPASPTLGGLITCMLSSPGNRDPFLYQWMLSPTAQYDGKIRLMQAGLNATEKTISFFNAYCTNLAILFNPGQRGGLGSSWLELQISPQRIAIGAILHDNNWPLDSHGAGETFTLASYYAANPAPHKPVKPLICFQVETATKAPTKAERYQARMSIIKAARTKMGDLPNGLPAPPEHARLEALTNRFEEYNRAIERARLADDIYVWGKEELYKNKLQQFRLILITSTPPASGFIMSAIAKLEKKLAEVQKKQRTPGVHPPEGWEAEEINGEKFHKDPKSGLVWAVYRSKFEDPANPVLVFRGTDNDDAIWTDWKTNGFNMIGSETAQYSAAIAIADELKRTKYGDKLEIAGHSKGAGQAATASTVTGLRGYTFNAAGVHDDLLAVYHKYRADASRQLNGKPLVNAYHFENDLLNWGQDLAQSERGKIASELTSKSLIISSATVLASVPTPAQLLDKAANSLANLLPTINRINSAIETDITNTLGETVGHTLLTITPGIALSKAVGQVGTQVVDGMSDIKQYLSNVVEYAGPPAIGVHTQLPAQDIDGRPVLLSDDLKKQIGERTEQHGMSYLINSMEKVKKDDLKAIGKQLGC